MFVFGRSSKKRLETVHADLQEVVKLALELSPVDFAVTEGVRTEARQRQLVSEGKSRTMKSRHLSGLAVDIAAYTGGSISWDWNLYVQIAEAFRKASFQLGTGIQWGAIWDRELNDIGEITQAEVDEYCARFSVSRPGRRPFLDGVHFQLTKREFPDETV